MRDEQGYLAWYRMSALFSLSWALAKCEMVGKKAQVWGGAEKSSKFSPTADAEREISKPTTENLAQNLRYPVPVQVSVLQLRCNHEA